MTGAEAGLRAARLGDEVVHGFGLLGMVAGALIGVAIGVAIVAAGIATGGLAIVAIVGGCIAGGGLAGGALARGIMKAADLPGPTTGILMAAGPSRVTVNSRQALRAGVDFSPACSGSPLNHYPLPGPLLIAQGAKTVTINGKPMARQSMKLICGAQIKAGSDNVTVGGPTATVVAIHSNEEMFETGLQILGFVALGAAALGAIAAGIGATLLFGGVVGGSMFGMEKLHEWGESLGPGYGDIMVGVTGFAALGLGARLAKPSPAVSSAEAPSVASRAYSYNAVENPGPLASLPNTPAGNFYSGKYNSSVLADDIVLYRGGKVGEPLGQWFTREPPSSVIQVRIDSAVKPQWIDPKTRVLSGSSPIDNVYAIKIPKGTTIYEGPVGSQGGVYLGGPNTNQIFVETPWKIPGVDVLSTTAIK